MAESTSSEQDGKARPKQHHKHIYKVLTGDQWEELQTKKETLGAPIDITDGYIHNSTSAQLAETVSKYFAKMEGVWLIAMDPTALASRGDGSILKWEPSRGGDLFPHTYGPLRLVDVVWAKPLPWDGEKHVFPEGVLSPDEGGTKS